MLVVTDRILIPDDEFRFEFARSGGPGGQNVNKVSSKATLRWTPATSPSLPVAVRERLLRAIAG
ncbi:MAG: protein chain release factor, partial [Planctomycetota bacterium]|nr:protein chain release factor [Planctomycetota bacterium]